MANYVFKMPDLGEGTVSAEILAWHVKPGDAVAEDQIIADVMTEKAAIEIPSPVSGQVVRTRGEPGEMIAVGSELIVFETGSDTAHKGAAGGGAATGAVQAAPAAALPVAATPAAAPMAVASTTAPAAAPASGRVMASPATRRRAQQAGVDLRSIAGSGPGGQSRVRFRGRGDGRLRGRRARRLRRLPRAARTARLR